MFCLIPAKDIHNNDWNKKTSLKPLVSLSKKLTSQIMTF